MSAMYLFIGLSLVSSCLGETYRELLLKARCRAICSYQIRDDCESDCENREVPKQDATLPDASWPEGIPRVLCQRPVLDDWVQFLLSWPGPERNKDSAFGNGTGNILIYVLEHRTRDYPHWIAFGKTEERAAWSAGSLRRDTEHQFRMTAVGPRGPVFGGPRNTRWIRAAHDFSQHSSGPKNLAVKSLGPDEDGKGLTFLVTWTPDSELSCYYRLNYLPHNARGHQVQTNVSPGLDLLGVVTKGLSYHTHYTVAVSGSRDPLYRTEGSPTVIEFSSPSCFQVNGFNFTLCAPTSPRNASVQQLNASRASITWQPPEFASQHNPLLKYQVTVVNKVDGMDTVEPINIKIQVPGNTPYCEVDDLKTEGTYQVWIWAVSKGGRGEPLTRHFEMIVMGNEKEHAVEDSTVEDWRFLMLTCAIVPPTVLVLGFCIGCCLYKISAHNKNKSEKRVVCQGHPRLLHPSPFQVDFSQLSLQEELGRGGFGVVHKGHLTVGGSTEVVAVKLLKDEGSSEHRRHLWQEIELLRLLGRHPHVVCLRAYVDAPPTLAMMVEYCPLGDLHTHLLRIKDRKLNDSFESGFGSCDSKEAISPDGSVEVSLAWISHSKCLLSYARQVAVGMEFIGSHRLVHRDLAARNVLIQSAQRIKITDLGLGRDVYERGLYSPSRDSGVGCDVMLPIRWMPLEAIKRQRFTTASDVWSFGILLWEMVTFGQTPYPGLGNQEVVRFLETGDRLQPPSHCNDTLNRLMSDCWSENPCRRPTFSELKTRLEIPLEEDYCLLLDEEWKDSAMEETEERVLVPTTELKD